MADIVEQQAGVFFLQGALEREHVLALWKQRAALMPQQLSVILDLSRLTRVDSAGMAMLIHLATEYRKAGVEVSFRHIPQQLMTLLRLSHAEELLATAK
ncbi:lipid asymmetry maintenance protein MlaB [Thaumasiovibrio sp. DFM-14]|uniref:STAS domain-containing protein n=1 Tax=Thaumasiovibrio sp. DFM-14 TaxID=3384792 RepID=UPI0039A17428